MSTNHLNPHPDTTVAHPRRYDYWLGGKDKDPLVVTHARAVLISTTELRRTAYLEADARAPHTILSASPLRDTLDLATPVGLLLIAVPHFLDDDSPARHTLTELVGALAPGSIVAISHATYDPLPDDFRHRLERELADPAARHGTVQPAPASNSKPCTARLPWSRSNPAWCPRCTGGPTCPSARCGRHRRASLCLRRPPPLTRPPSHRAADRRRCLAAP